MSEELEKRFAFPWYSKGLPFSCTQCGKCCTGAPGYVWTTEEEIAQMAEFLKFSVQEFKKRYIRRIGQRLALVERKAADTHSCIFYHNKQCQVYSTRPFQCRAYPFWQENVLSEESWKLAAQECEGIHSDAPVIPQKDIEGFLDAQRRQGPEEHFVMSSPQ